MATINKTHSLLYLLIFFILICIQSCGQKEKTVESANFDYAEVFSQKIQEIEKENINRHVEDQYVYWGNDSLTSSKLSDLTDGKRIFFYYTQQTCQPCVEETVKYIEAEIPKYISDDRIHFISPDMVKRFRNDAYGKKLLVLEKEKIGLPIEGNAHIPFFVVINKDLSIETIHVVDKMNYNRTKTFLRNIMKNWNN